MRPHRSDSRVRPACRPAEGVHGTLVGSNAILASLEGGVACSDVQVIDQVRTLVDELAALSWEVLCPLLFPVCDIAWKLWLAYPTCDGQKSMQTVKEADYTEALNHFINRAIASGRGLDERDGDGRTALHWAAANGHQVDVVCFVCVDN